MDVDAALALVTAAAGGAATAAGQRAWEGLLSLWRRTTGRPEPQPVDPGDGGSVRWLVDRMTQQARSDPEFASALCRWAGEHHAVLTVEQSAVHNTVAPDATVNGPVIQARDIHGDIHFR
ncbi:hypothetical protein E0L36_05755 [Streptomyces sp. AJS327]|uniref:hypothetical protein n=1 Tax=Streptomyces sp. AJS327 TaxID=2545265 RepID=UPI0015DE0877|nr:hypothetical protein [Streptomyces sp. AJS327]MBA0050417.1 hypothetical protein [Streptomyces sp. AJS327]